LVNPQLLPSFGIQAQNKHIFPRLYTISGFVTSYRFFSQVDDQSITKRTFHNLFNGSEIIIAGKTKDDLTTLEVDAISLDGPVRFIPTVGF